MTKKAGENLRPQAPTAPSPNLAIRDFSSSIWAALTLNLTLLLLRSNSVIFASRALSLLKISGRESAASLARSAFLILTINFLSWSIATLTPVFRTSCILVVITSPVFFLLSLNQSRGSLSRALFENLIFSSLISIIFIEILIQIRRSLRLDKTKKILVLILDSLRIGLFYGFFTESLKLL